MHYRKYRLALAFVIAFIVGSAANLWYIWFSAALTDSGEISFSTNFFHEQLGEFFLICLFFLALGWLLIRRKEVAQLLRIIEKEELRKRSWWE